MLVSKLTSFDRIFPVCCLTVISTVELKIFRFILRFSVQPLGDKELDVAFDGIVTLLDSQLGGGIWFGMA